jgi:quercetin dioxygenase-like cupin family protein
MNCSESGIDRIRELTATIGPPTGIVTAPGLKQYHTVGGKILAWTIHWQEEFAICHAFLSANACMKQHVHDEKEWVIVVSGRAIIKTQLDTIIVEPRQEIVIDPHTPHEISCEEDTYVVAITMPAAQDWPKR